MNNTDKEYFKLLNTILTKGRVKKNRTGIDTIGVFGEQAKFNVGMNAFPILTTKKVWFKGIVHELLWFISGNTNIKYLVDNGVHIWDEWAHARYKKNWGINADPKDYTSTEGKIHHIVSQEEFIQKIKEDMDFAIKWGELGEGTYGGMWREFPYYKEYEEDGNEIIDVDGVDQLQKVLDTLKTNPDDRRMIVSAWHPYWVDHCALPPCHCLFHFNTEELNLEERLDLLSQKQNVDFTDSVTHGACDKENIPTRRLNCLLYQRSCDTFLGVPFNITSYSLLLAMVAHVSNMVPGVFTHTYGDLHIYENHREQVQLQMGRVPHDLPQLWLNPDIKNLIDFKYDDIKLKNYKCHSAIKGEVAV